MPLTPKQRAFCDYYIETGNASEAARRAGYSEKTATAIGYENLTKPQISEYIASRMAEIESTRIATAEEVMQFYTGVMRGEIRDQFGLDTSISDRINAAKEIMKRHAASGTAMPGAGPVEDDPLTAALRELGEKLANQ